MIKIASVPITRVRFELRRGNTMTSRYETAPSAVPTITATVPAPHADQPLFRVRSQNTNELAMPIAPVAKFTTPLLRYIRTRPIAESATSAPDPMPNSSRVMIAAIRLPRDFLCRLLSRCVQLEGCQDADRLDPLGHVAAMLNFEYVLVGIKDARESLHPDRLGESDRRSDSAGEIADL